MELISCLIKNAFQRQNGQFIWKYTVTGPIQTNPTIVNNTVYFGSNDRKMYALDANTGQVKWSYDSGDAIWRSSPSVADNTVVFGSNGKLFGLNATTGALKWSLPATSENPIIRNNVVYAGTEGYALAINANTGAIIWKQLLGLYVTSDPTIDEKNVYILNGDNNQVEYIYALDRSTGAVVWKKISPVRNTSRQPIAANGRLYISYNDYEISLLDVSDGKLIRAINNSFESITFGIMLKINNTVYYPAISGMLQ